MNSLIWRGVSSTTIKGLLICELPPITKPQMRVSETVIDGRDGSTFEELGYSSYDKAVQIGLYGEYDIDKVIKYFTGEGDIIFSNEPTKVYSAKICSQIDYNRLLRYRQATVVFRVQPFKHKYNEAIRETPSATASGTSIVVSDCEEAHLKAFKIYGKSTQNGTPTPDAPVDIVSIGDDGNIGVNVNGINLFNLQSGVIFGSTTPVTFIENGFILNANNQTNRLTSFKCKLKKGNTYFLSYDFTKVSGIGNASAYIPKTQQYLMVNKSFVALDDSEEICIYTDSAYVPSVINVRNIQISMTSEKKDYELYKNQSIILSNPLRAIPVTDKSLATYTDADGKMWCADEIDLDRGVYVQRVKNITLDGTESWSIGGKTLGDGSDWYYTTTVYNDAENTGDGKVVCTHYPYGIINNGNAINGVAMVWKSLRIRWGTMGTVADFKSWLLLNPIQVIYRLETPIETPLTDEQIAICKSLKANNPTTTILNDENAYMMVEYIKPFEVMNEGLEPSKPIMTLNGSGTVEISVNGLGIFSYTFPEGENEVVIDSEKQDAYLNGVLKNRNMNGEFPILQPKTNRIRWSGDIKNIKVFPRSRWL